MWSASRLGRFIPGKRNLGAYWIEGSVGSKAILFEAAKNETLAPSRN
jgi:hypothetical protein